MADDYNPSLLDAVTEALQDVVHDDKSGGAQGGVVTRWIGVIEVMQIDGSKWLLRLDRDAAGKRLVSWDRRGLLHEALDDKAWGDDD